MDALKVSLLAIFGAFQLFSLTSAIKNESQLFKDVFKNYDPLVWPNQENDRNWSIATSMFINSLVDFNEKDQILSISAIFFLTWTEPLLAWDPTEYNVEVLYVPPHMIWRPDIIIQNAVENYGQIGKDNLKVYLESSGMVMWVPGDFYKLYCKVDVRHYPFDTQTCTVSLDPWSCPSKIINLDLSEKPIRNVPSEENGEWKMIGAHARRVWKEYGQRYRIDFDLVIQRKTLFYVINMILPIVFLSMLNSLAFALPANSGEKMTLCISVLLSFAVFLTLVNDALPENSDGVCFFSAYLATEIFMSAASTIVTVVVISYHHKTPPTVRVKRWMTWILPEPNKVYDEVWAIKNLNLNPEEQVTTKSETKEAEETRLVDRSDVAAALDRFCLKFFSLANVIVTLAFFCSMYGGI